MQLRVALIGEESAGVQALRLLMGRGHDVVAAFTRSGDESSVASVRWCAASRGVPVRDAREVRDPATAGWLQAQGVDLLLNVHSLEIVDGAVLAAPTLGSFNLHPGPLPDRAGLHAPSWAVYTGAERHGVTLHRMTSEVDAGAIAFAETFAIAPRDTGLSVMVRCTRLGIGLVERLLDVAEQGREIPARPQDPKARRWFPAGPPEGGRLDWRRSARQVADSVRACDYRPFASPWGFPRCRAGRLEVAIVSARALAWETTASPGSILGADGGRALAAAADTWVEVETVELDGKVVAAGDVLAS